MKVVILSTFERIGGAAIAANRLMHALRITGIDAKMIVRDKQSEDSQVIAVNSSFISKIVSRIYFFVERLFILFYKRFRREDLFKISIANTGSNIDTMALVKTADIIHLHWINQGFLSLYDIAELVKLGKPIVWTLHDMWPCTGICHHARDCENYKEQCGNCFFLDSRKENDLSRKIFLKKKRLYEEHDFTFIACSEWLASRAQKSGLLVGKKIKTIPNPISSDFFYPLGENNSRELLGLPSDKYLLLFGALNVTDKRKGIDYLIQALGCLQKDDPDLYKNVGLVVFGKVKDEIKQLFSVPIYSMGYLTDNEKLVTLYNSVDLFVTSSLEENLPNTIMEAMACGIPCVGFRIGGIPEMIEHKKNGYVAEYMSAEDLAEGIKWVLNNQDKSMLKYNCMEKVKREYASTIVAEKYISVYQSLLRN